MLDPIFLFEYATTNSTHALAHPYVAFASVRQCVAELRYDVDGRDPFVVREMISFWHRIVRVDVDLFGVGIGGLEKEVEVM